MRKFTVNTAMAIGCMGILLFCVQNAFTHMNANLGPICMPRYDYSEFDTVATMSNVLMNFVTK